MKTDMKRRNNNCKELEMIAQDMVGWRVLMDTPIPKQLRPLAYRIDNFGIQIVNSFRRFPVIRLTVIIYLIILHLSIIIVSFMPVDNMKTVTVGGSGSSKVVIENPPVEANRLPHALNKP
ncbi:unnamed protein product [Schistosoma curassoni]|uniref:Transmembrane protein n=1 Tax=Schistosoma curassoni TaxID=6186 RepID=A0A183KZC4_9TREM|nr:unnamed protein product [Schistosoma curassoni]